MKRRIIVVVTAVVMVMCVVLAVCTKLEIINTTKNNRIADDKGQGTKRSGEKGDSKPKQLKVLYVGVEANADAAKFAAQKYKAQKGIDVIVESFPQLIVREKLFVEMSTQNAYYDIYLIDGPWCAASAPYLLNLLPLVNNPAITDPKLLAVDDFIPKIMAQCVYDQDNPSSPPMEFQLPDFVWKAPIDLIKLSTTNYELIGLPFHPNVLVLG